MKLVLVRSLAIHGDCQPDTTPERPGITPSLDLAVTAQKGGSCDGFEPFDSHEMLAHSAHAVTCAGRYQVYLQLGLGRLGCASYRKALRASARRAVLNFAIAKLGP